MSAALSLDPKTTALVLIDLQNAIAAMPLEPRSSADVIAASKGLADRFRAAGAMVVLVNVTWAKDYSDWPALPVDMPPARPAGGMPEGADRLVDGLFQPGDLRVTKRNWSAFHGTELDLLLRRRGIATIVLGGIATNFGVESTARSAYELNYGVVVAEDACASPTAELHRVSMTGVMPRVARVRQSADIAL
ncbi:hydrolase [Asticcacaulis solisilvae]|uniref:hydrolase n=1 Tax=Asticcacaulis solisilvae TaxID=1217274 RepID=UPI003FD84BFD